MKGYKGFNADLTCRGFQYKIGNTYTCDGEIELCEKGFHFCKSLKDVLYYYNFSNGHRFCEVEAVGDVIEGEDKCVTNKIKIIKEIEITVDILRELATNKDWWIIETVASHPNTPLDILRELAQDENVNVRYEVAINPHTDSKTLSKLAQDEYDCVRYVVAKHPHTDSKTLSELSQDKYWRVRYFVAKHHNTDSKTLSELSQDEYDCVRYVVAKNPNYV